MRTNDIAFDTGPAQAIPNDDSDAASLTLPHSDLLWQGEFSRHGPDLTLTGPDAQRFIIPDYFTRDVPPDLVSPDGAMLQGKVIELLAGPRAADQYAQAAAPAPAAQLIGKVEKVSGATTVVRNGVAVTVNVGDLVYKGDVLQTGGNSQLSVSFSDGTALSLTANSRMAMTEFIYDPNSTSNSGVMSLLQGGFVFISGQVAHTGGLNFQTPVATMGIRGTAGGCACVSQNQCQIFATRNVDGSLSIFQIIPNPNIGITTPLLAEVGTLVQITPNAPAQFIAAANLSPIINNLMNELRSDYPQIIQNLVTPQRTDLPTNDPLRASTAIVGSSNTVAIDLPNSGLTPIVPAVGLVGPAPLPPVTTPVFVTIVLVADAPPPPPPESPPVTVANPIGNQGSPEDAVWTFAIPADVFSDPTVTIVVQLANGDALETVGLSFDPATRTISGTPSPDFNGPIVITVVAGDGTVTDSFTLNVAPVNDAPTALAGDASLTPISEPTGEAPGAPAGETVAAVLGPVFSDAADQVPGGSQANGFAGIAVVFNPAAPGQGAWQYFDGSQWVDIPNDVSQLHALLLSADTLIRFLPTDDFNGEAPKLTVHLIDDSAGGVVTGEFAVLSATGDPTPYSAEEVLLGQTVLPTNDPPVANDDVASTAQLAPVDIDVLANDTDVDGDSLSIALGALAPTAEHGTVVVVDGILRYTPDAGHSGLDTITYRVTDGTDTDVGQVTVNTVAGVTIRGSANADLIDQSHSAPGQPFATIGHDNITGAGGNDDISGGGGNDTIDGGAGNDSIHGDAGNDILDGGAGNDLLFGDAGNDVMTGGTGLDTYSGGEGNDLLVVAGTNDINDIFDGGAGFDRLVTSTNTTLAGFDAAASSIESLQTNGRSILGTAAANVLDFSGLQEIISSPPATPGILNVDGAGGDDTIIGSQFNDVLLGGAGNDHLTGGRGDDTLTGGTGTDTFHFRDLIGNNANFGKDQILLFETSSDVIEFDHNIFNSAQAALDSAHDDGLGNTVITADANNTITLQGVLAANLHLSNFSIV